MRRGFLVVVGVIVIVAVLAFVWWLPAYREAQLQDQIAAIEAMEDQAARMEAALDFLLSNQLADRELLLRALDAAASEFREKEDNESLIELYESLYVEDLTPWLHYRVLARLDRALVEAGGQERVSRAEELARSLLDVQDAPAETYQWIVYFHSQNPLTDPELIVDVALAADQAVDAEEEAGMVPWMVETAFGTLLARIEENEGAEAALAYALEHAPEAVNPFAKAALHAAVYDRTVEDDPDAALQAAQAIASIPGLEDHRTMNRVAFDMAERELAPDVAIQLGRQALEIAPSSYDSLMILDTVGWAHYAGGQFDAAAEYLSQAVDLMDETLTFSDNIVQHLLAAYEAGGMDDERIDLLALIAARSVEADDPARAQLAALLIARDGSDAQLDTIIRERRYEGVEAAPAFRLRDRSGNLVDMQDFAGDVLLICFWSYG